MRIRGIWCKLTRIELPGCRCTLPIELWFYSSEMPRPAMQKVLLEMGVFCRNVEDLFPGGAQTVRCPLPCKPRDWQAGGVSSLLPISEGTQVWKVYKFTSDGPSNQQRV